MSSVEDQRAANFRLALDLFEAGEVIMRQNLRRRYPDSSEAAIESRLGEWLQRRPGAEQGDCLGRLRASSQE